MWCTIGEDAVVDLARPVQLGLRENAFASRLQKEAIPLLALQVAHAPGVLDQIVIGVWRVILGDALGSSSSSEIRSANHQAPDLPRLLCRCCRP